MNILLSNAAKSIILCLLEECTNEQILMFKRMYSKGNIDLDIKDVVYNMNDDNLDIAITQCQKTVEKNKKYLKLFDQKIPRSDL